MFHRYPSFSCQSGQRISHSTDTLLASPADSQITFLLSLPLTHIHTHAKGEKKTNQEHLSDTGGSKQKENK